MPVDPNVAMGVTTPTLPNPLAQMGQYVGIQNALNQNQLFQQQFAGKKRIGEILSTAPDLETGLSQIQMDPTAAPWAGEVVKSVREGQLANIKMQGEVQSQSQSALTGVLKALAPAYNDPSMLGPLIEAQKATMSPSALARSGKAVDAIMRGMSDGLQGLSPEDAQKRYHGNLVGLMTSAGLSPADIQNLSASNAEFNAGGSTFVGTRAPAWAGGAFTPATQITNSLAPTTISGKDATNADVVRAVGGGGGAVTQLGAAVGGGNALVPKTPAVAPTAPSNLLTGQSAVNRTFSEDQGKAASEYTTNLNNTVNSASDMLKSLGEIRPLLSKVSTDGLTPYKLEVANILKGLGASEETYNGVLGGSLPAAQEIQKLFVNNTTSQMKTLMGSMGGHWTEGEFNTFIKSNPTLATDKDAINKIFNFWQGLYTKAHAEQKWRTEQPPGTDVTTLPSKWQDEMVKRKFIDPEAKNGEAPASPKIDPTQFIRP